MLVKEIKKPKGYDNYLSSKTFWFSVYNTNIKIDNLFNPKTLSEKLTWYNMYCKYNSKLHFKCTAKDEIAKKLGTDKYCIPTYQMCNNVDEINWQNLINKKIVIKADNSASSVGVVMHKKSLKQQDIPNLIRKINNNKNLQKGKIIIEQFIGSYNTKNIFQTDYKLWCFFGKVLFIEVINGRSQKNTHMCYSTFFDKNFNKIDLKRIDYEQCKKTIKKPNNFEEMIDVAEKISSDIPAVRVDLYNINGKIYFGECTKLYSYHCNFENNNDEKMSYIFDLSKIPENIIKKEYMNYDVAINSLTQEAKEILGCTDDNFEFIWAINVYFLPLYYNGENKNMKIYYHNNVWMKLNEYNCVYNKKYKKFENLKDEEIKNILRCKTIQYCYDIDGDILYYDKNNPYTCFKYNNENIEKAEYKTVKIKTSNIQIYNKKTKKFE